jgi:hypothetical protein
LIDAGPTAREAGFRWPVAVTAAAWEDWAAWSESDRDRYTHQDQSGRLWDALFMAAYAARANADAGPEPRFAVYRVPRDGRTMEAELTKLQLVVSPADDGEPVVSNLLPQED